MAIAGRHRDVARIILTSIGKIRGKPTLEAPWGLAGGNALIAHRVSGRPTLDVDVFISEMRGDWKNIEAAIEEGLADSGYSVEPVDKLGGIADWISAAEDEEPGLSEWIARAPGDDVDVQVQVSNFDLLVTPVDMPGIGPVLALPDVAGWKAVAFSNRRMPRDIADIAELRTRFTVDELLRLARERDPGMDPADIAGAGQYLDRVDDAVLTAVLAGTGRTPAWVRQQLDGWPRTAPPRQ
jgi:Nucleotidyl transferase AbiEii toxin, Type IV TA system